MIAAQHAEEVALTASGVPGQLHAALLGIRLKLRNAGLVHVAVVGELALVGFGHHHDQTVVFGARDGKR